jgi:hypothetical protein
MLKKHFVCGLMTGFILTDCAYGAARRSPSHSGDDEVTIGVYDYGQAGPEVLRKAERVTTEIFRNAGVSTVWIWCRTSDTLPRNTDCGGPLKLTLHVIHGSGALDRRLKSDALGLAAVGDHGELGWDIWVFYDQVKDSAVQAKLSLTRILGSVIAHELGHLLLGSNSHSMTGLMRARWSREELLAADLGELTFSAAERKRMQKALAARREAIPADRGMRLDMSGLK